MGAQTKVTISLSDQLLRDLRDHAAQNESTVTDVLRRAARLYLRIASTDDVVIRDADTGVEKVVWLL